MIDVEKKEDVESVRKENPFEIIRWIRPDGWMEYYEPQNEQPVLIPPRPTSL